MLGRQKPQRPMTLGSCSGATPWCGTGKQSWIPLCHSRPALLRLHVPQPGCTRHIGCWSCVEGKNGASEQSISDEGRPAPV